MFLEIFVTVLTYLNGITERTKLRPLASGDLTQFKALSFLGVQLSLGLAVLTQLNLYRSVLVILCYF